MRKILVKYLILTGVYKNRLYHMYLLCYQKTCYIVIYKVIKI